MTQITVGLQLGGQAYSQIIFFQNKKAFDDFTGGNFEFGAQAHRGGDQIERRGAGDHRRTSAGASSTGAAATPRPRRLPERVCRSQRCKGGLMYEASIGGQKFSYEAKATRRSSVHGRRKWKDFGR